MLRHIDKVFIGVVKIYLNCKIKKNKIKESSCGNPECSTGLTEAPRDVY